MKLSRTADIPSAKITDQTLFIEDYISVTPQTEGQLIEAETLISESVAPAQETVHLLQTHSVW